jgi:hypothetical protein
MIANREISFYLEKKTVNYHSERVCEREREREKGKEFSLKILLLKSLIIVLI